MTSAASIASTLAKKGQAVTIEGASAATYDTATGSASGTPYSDGGSAVLLPLNLQSAKYQANQDIIAGDEQMLLSALIAKPPIGATITLADGTTKYTLIALDPLHPAGEELLYDCVVRGH